MSDEAIAPPEEADAPGVPPDTPETGSPPSRTDRVLLALLGVYAALCLLAAVAQLSENRFLLDLFDLRRWFTR